MVTSPSSATEVVLDASVVIRALVDLDRDAQRWLRCTVAWPTLIYAEVGNTLLRLCRSGVTTRERARDALDTLHTATADRRPMQGLVQEAWDVALDRGLTVYDACYVVLAEGLDVPLVTADRRLAAATSNAVLIA